jgi:transketolase
MGQHHAGNPERGLTPGVETTTGPLGRGFGGVGMAMAEAHLAACYNRRASDHYTYGIVSDGDVMEGVASKQHVVGPCSSASSSIFTTTTASRFPPVPASRSPKTVCGASKRTDGTRYRSMMATDRAIERACCRRDESTRPSLIAVRTHIGYGRHINKTRSKRMALRSARSALDQANLGWPTEQAIFRMPRRPFRKAVQRGAQAKPNGHEIRRVQKRLA